MRIVFGRALGLAAITISLAACTAGPQPQATAVQQPFTSPAPTAPAVTEPAPQATATPSGGETTFQTEDGVKLDGRLLGTGSVGLVLAPMYPGGQEGWTNFASVAAGKGYRVLTFDLRGYGKSEGTPGASNAPDDLRAALATLKASGSSRIVLIGAGVSGMAAIKVAPADKAVVGIVVISSSRKMDGLEITDADAGALSVPSLWLAARNDMAQNVEDLYKVAGGPKKDLWVYEGASVQGTYILEGSDGPDMQAKLLAFIASVAQ